MTVEPDIVAAVVAAIRGGDLVALQGLIEAHLLGYGADINTTVPYADGSALDVVPGLDTRRDLLANWLREQGAR